MPRTPHSTTKSGTGKTEKQKQKQSKRSKNKLPRIPKRPKKLTPKKDRRKKFKTKKAKKTPKAASVPVRTPSHGVKTAQSVSKPQPLNTMKATKQEGEEGFFHIEKWNNEKPEISTNLDSIIADKNPLTKKTVQIALIKKIHDADAAEEQQAEAQNENMNRSIEGEEASINEVQQIAHQMKNGEDHDLADRQQKPDLQVMERSRYVLPSMSPKERSFLQTL